MQVLTSVVVFALVLSVLGRVLGQAPDELDKRKIWSTARGVWGKRGWENARGVWGKRSWDTARGVWGKRALNPAFRFSPPIAFYEEVFCKFLLIFFFFSSSYAISWPMQ